MTRRFFIGNERAKALALAELAALPVDKPMLFSVDPYRPKRSLAQNALAHLWIDALRRHLLETTGKVWDHDSLWEAVKQRTLSPKVVPDLETGEARLVYETRKLTTPEFSDWLHIVEQYCHEKFELQLPHPEDLYDDAHAMRRDVA